MEKDIHTKEKIREKEKQILSSLFSGIEFTGIILYEDTAYNGIRGMYRVTVPENLFGDILFFGFSEKLKQDAKDKNVSVSFCKEIKKTSYFKEIVL